MRASRHTCVLLASLCGLLAAVASRSGVVTVQQLRALPAALLRALSRRPAPEQRQQQRVVASPPRTASPRRAAPPGTPAPRPAPAPPHPAAQAAPPPAPAAPAPAAPAPAASAPAASAPAASPPPPAAPSVPYGPTRLSGVPRRPKAAVVIVVWAPPFCPKRNIRRGDAYCHPRTYTAPCPEQLRRRCTITVDRGAAPTADAVVLPLASRKGLPRLQLAEDAVTVAWAWEAPPSPLGQLSGGDPGFNWTMGYRKDGDVPFSYAWDMHFGRAVDRDPAVRSRPLSRPVPPNRTAAALALVSNCKPERKAAIEALARHFPVTLRGNCWGHRVDPAELDRLLCSHLFHLAYENTHCRHYVTEKYWRAIAHGAIPVVNGPRGDYPPHGGPPGAEINANDYSTARELAAALRDAAGPAQLRRLQAWRQGPDPLGEAAAAGMGWCALCDSLIRGGQQRQWYPDLRRWLSMDGAACPAAAPAWSAAWAA
eukprot:TRINITY_DN20234_c0_g1_i1.p1 TRINITY_DN20234_c0_g1~~TRINITY_DN20234_c0_g1_i1.p1  ORF type:complete len:510 (+),score=114.14 TRINITY_DN20234_c0_g1_i1:85-1530(+)